MTISLAPILRAWRRSPANVWIQLRAPEAATVQFLDLIGEMSDETWDRSEVSVQLGSETPSGPVALVDAADDVALGAWLEELVRRLEGRGVDGRVQLFRSIEYPAWMVSPPPVPTAFIGWSCVRDPRLTPNQQVSAWSVPPPETLELTRHLSAWGGQVAGDQIVVGTVNLVAVPPTSDAARLLARQVARQSRGGAAWIANDERRARLVNLGSSGTSAAQVLDESTDASSRIDALRDVVVGRSDLIDIAFVRRSAVLGLWTGLDIPSKLPVQNGATAVRYARHVLDRWVPDAHGIQVLTDAHLQRAHDLTAWRVTDLGSGRHLVEAPDLRAWYGSTTPDPTTLQVARGDFGDMILTQEDIDANPLPGSIE